MVAQRSSLDWDDLSPKVGIPKAAPWKLKLQVIPWPGGARLHGILQRLREAGKLKGLKQFEACDVKHMLSKKHGPRNQFTA